MKLGQEVGFNSNREVERSGEYGSSVRTNRPSLLPSKRLPKCQPSNIKSKRCVAKLSAYYIGGVGITDNIRGWRSRNTARVLENVLGLMHI